MWIWPPFREKLCGDDSQAEVRFDFIVFFFFNLNPAWEFHNWASVHFEIWYIKESN